MHSQQYIPRDISLPPISVTKLSSSMNTLGHPKEFRSLYKMIVQDLIQVELRVPFTYKKIYHIFTSQLSGVWALQLYSVPVPYSK